MEFLKTTYSYIGNSSQPMKLSEPYNQLDEGIDFSKINMTLISTIKNV